MGPAFAFVFAFAFTMNFFFSFTHLPMMRLLSVLLLVFCFSAVFAESGARLVISRAILNEELIIGKDTVVNVEIYNVGDE